MIYFLSRKYVILFWRLLMFWDAWAAWSLADSTVECSKAALLRRERQVVVGVVFGVVCDYLRDLREIYCGFVLVVNWVLLRVILPQITQMTQTNTAELYYFAEYFVWIIGVIGDYLVIVWVLLREYSPADSADYADECSKLHYFAEKDRLFEIKAVLLFGVLSA